MVDRRVHELDTPNARQRPACFGIMSRCDVGEQNAVILDDHTVCADPGIKLHREILTSSVEDQLGAAEFCGVTYYGHRMVTGETGSIC